LHTTDICRSKGKRAWGGTQGVGCVLEITSGAVEQIVESSKRNITHRGACHLEGINSQGNLRINPINALLVLVQMSNWQINKSVYLTNPMLNDRDQDLGTGIRVTHKT
jgi:hypothetical protein